MEKKNNKKNILLENINLLSKDKKINLRSIKQEDVYGNWWGWFNDPEVTLYMNKGVKNNTIEDQLAFYNKVVSSDNNLVLAICDHKTNKHIGTTGLHNISWLRGNAQFGIIIGEKDYWGVGVGSKAWRMIINYGFENLKLKLIDTKIFSKNLASIKIAEKCGFQTIKLLKNDVEKNGKMYDRVYMVLNQNNWEKHYKI